MPSSRILEQLLKKLVIARMSGRGLEKIIREFEEDESLSGEQKLQILSQLELIISERRIPGNFDRFIDFKSGTPLASDNSDILDVISAMKRRVDNDN